MKMDDGKGTTEDMSSEVLTKTDKKSMGTETGEMENMKKENKEINEDDSKMTEQHNHSETIVREGVIDVESIDKNKDGRVYQDMMDWNVISDEPGKCPLCGMTLKEVSIDEAKKNLKENGFEYKK